MITVAILVNGQPIAARTAVNTGKSDYKGVTEYKNDDGSTIYHHPKDGAVKLAIKMLKTIKEVKK